MNYKIYASFQVFCKTPGEKKNEFEISTFIYADVLNLSFKYNSINGINRIREVALIEAKKMHKDADRVCLLGAIELKESKITILNSDN